MSQWGKSLPDALAQAGRSTSTTPYLGSFTRFNATSTTSSTDGGFFKGGWWARHKSKLATSLITCPNVLSDGYGPKCS